MSTSPATRCGLDRRLEERHQPAHRVARQDHGPLGGCLEEPRQPAAFAHQGGAPSGSGRSAEPGQIRGEDPSEPRQSWSHLHPGEVRAAQPVYEHERLAGGPVPAPVHDGPVDVDGLERRQIECHPVSLQSGPDAPRRRVFCTACEALHKTFTCSELYFFTYPPYHGHRTAKAFAQGGIANPWPVRDVSGGATPSSRRPAVLRPAAERLRGGG